MTRTLTIRQPDDWHLHLRDGDMLRGVIAASARDFGRAIIMPNLVPPVADVEQVQAYRARIEDALKARGAAGRFIPLMTLYLTDTTDADTVVNAATAGLISAVKLYPAGATTHSSAGVTDIECVMPVLERMAEAGIVLCVHGEVTDPSVDIFDREARFIDTVLAPLRHRLPELRVVLEHVTTADGVQFVQSHVSNQAGTVTPHHLLLNRNHLLAGGIRPHYYCLPVVKRERHRTALIEAVTSGDSRFFIGTDSAPHLVSAKQSACGCAGVFNAGTALSCYATVFEEAGALGWLEAFVSLNGPAFYKMAPNERRLRLKRCVQPLAWPRTVRVGEEEVVVFDPGRPLYWAVTPDVK